MKSILPKYDDLDKVAEEAAIKIFMEDMKKCSKCGEVKSTGEFSKDNRLMDGLHSICKACKKTYDKAYREANKDKMAEWHKAYREANKEKIAEKKKAWCEANKEKVAEKLKAYYEENKEKIAERIKDYYEANKEKINERNKTYREENKEKIAEKKKTYNEANKDAIADKNKAYREANKDKIKTYREVRRNKHIEQLKKIIEPNTDGKWIYIMQCGIYHKIGISSDPLTRVQYIENMTQAPTELIYLAKANYGRTIDTEQIIHHELSSLNVPMPYANGKHKDHVSKEWFFGSLDKMVEIVGQYATISEVD
jgi:hypothetical protein